MKSPRRRLSAATRAFRDAVRDILAEEGWFELEIPEPTDWRKRYLTPLGPTATA